jgi:energy-coupling factor transporter ATP-binding protein EcfA2
MSTANLPGRTNKELLKALRAPVARFYPFDLHTHSIGSHDVCVGDRFLALPEELRTALVSAPTPSSPGSSGDSTPVPAAQSTRPSLPLTKEPTDHQKHDHDVATPEFVTAFYNSLRNRRDALVTQENISPSDNWCVIGITDHNTVQFSTLLSQHAWSHRGNDRLIILPGIELEVRFPVEGTTCPLHILCLFAPCTTASDIRLSINESRPQETPTWDFGVPISVAQLPPFIHKLRCHSRYPAICVAAHVWSSKGIANEPKKIMLESLHADIARLQGELQRAKDEKDGSDEREIDTRLKKLVDRRDDTDELHLAILQLIGLCGFDGLQVRDQSHEAHYRRLHRFRDQYGRAVPIVSSDSHTPSGVFLSGDNIPYIKLDVGVLSGGDTTAVFDEIRKRALRFGETRTTYSTPGRVSYWIEGIEIVPDASDAREFWEDPSAGSPAAGAITTFTLPLSQNLNCFIGGRGSGKSSLIEAIAFLADDGKFNQQATVKNEDNREDWYRRAEATLRGCRLRLVWKTTAAVGIGTLPKRSLFVTRYFDPAGRHPDAEKRDAHGNAIVDATISVPKLQLLRAHEIERTAQSDNLRKLFDGLCGADISGLSQSVEEIRERLKKQRALILNTCKQIAELTKEGGPLRQYGIRKKQFEAVDKPELRVRFEQVDQAELISKAAAAIKDTWDNVNGSDTLASLENDLVMFFENATTSVTDESGAVVVGHESIHENVCNAADSEKPGLREDVLAAVRAAKAAIERGDSAFEKTEADSQAVLQRRRDELAKDGLPTGSSAREAKKKAFDEAKVDHQKYLTHVGQFDVQLAERTKLFEQLVEVSRKRTVLRKTHADDLTMQLRRDLDGDVLSIEVQAKPLAERGEFATWLERHLDAAFSKYRPQRRTALLESGLMPSTLRDILLHDGTPDTSMLTNQREKAEDGRINAEDCTRILELCRGRRLVALDEADLWTEEFAASLPADLQKGVVLFPPSAGGLCIDHALSLDEVVLDDVPEILLNDRPSDPKSEPRPLRDLSPGQRCSAILPLLLLSGDYPLVIDQPEENLDNRLIRQVIVNILASMKLRRQVIIATHNPNLPVLGDAEQCVVLQASGRDLSRLVAVGSLDSPHVARYITDIMEGGREAFQYRQSIYQTYWDSVVDDASIPPAA